MYKGHELNLGFSMERGSLMYNVKRKPYKLKTKGESINEYIRVRSSHSSDEVFVMKMERRGCASPARDKANWKREEPESFA